MNDPYTNVHGRRPGRGWRPYLLLPKVLAVAVYFGGLVAMLALEVMDVPVFTPVMVRLHDWVLLPALAVVLVLGAMLTGLHGSVLLRMRWLQVKLLIGLSGLLVGHVWLRLALSDVLLLDNTVIPLCILIALTGVVIVLGRHKPRLGQNIARAYEQA